MSGANGTEHHATVDGKPGLKMKIKRKNVSATKTTAAEVKHEIIKPMEVNTSPEVVGHNADGSSAVPDLPSPLDRLKQALAEKDKERTASGKSGRGGAHKKDKGKNKDMSVAPAGLGANSAVAMATMNSNSQDGQPSVVVKKEPSSDPYEFNAKVEDRHPDPLPVTKKIKIERMDGAGSSTDSTQGTSMMHTLGTTWGRRDVGVETNSIGVVTDPDCLGPCEPGTHVVLEGIVWNETPNGILVVNVTWRGKTYVGTLMDATRHDWAPPRFNDDSPTNELDSRTPKGRGKRGRAAASTPVSESCTIGERRLRKTRGRMGSSAALAQQSQPGSPGKAGDKRKGRPPEQELGLDGPKAPKRGRGASRSETPNSDGLIECPEANCSKKYRHINGLRYHLTHSHKKNLIFDNEGNIATEPTEEFVKPAPVTDGQTSPKVKNGRKPVGDKTSTDSPRKSEQDNISKTPAESPKKAGESDTENKKCGKKQSADNAKKSDKKAVVSVAPVSTVPCVSIMRTIAGGTVTMAQASIATMGVTLVTSSGSDKKHKGTKVGKPGVVGSLPGPRPIMPAPTTLASVTTYPQVTVGGGSMTSSLQPIQPRPTVLGSPNTVDPALAASLKQMKQEKKAKKKKKDKDKDKERGQGHKKDKEHKPHTSVIKATTVTIPTAAAVATSNGTVAPVKAPPELHRQNLQPPELDKQRLTPPELHKQQVKAAPVSASGEAGRGNRPPSSLSLNSPMTRPREGGEQDSDDVHSPAYSDISDANDSVPVLENEVEGKASKESAAAKPAATPMDKGPGDKGASTPTGIPPTDRNGAPAGYNMYNNFYGQPPYLTPAVGAGSPKQQGPPGQGAPGPKPSEDGKHGPIKTEVKSGVPLVPKREHPSPSQSSKDPDRKPKDSQPNSPSVAPKTPQSNKEGAEKGGLRPGGMYPPGSPYAGYLGTGYGFMGGMDPAYHMQLMATNPEYKMQYERWMKGETERRRMLQEQHTPVDMSAKSKSHPTTPSGPPSTKSFSSPTVASPSTASPGSLESRLRGVEVKKEVQDLSLKEKQNENRQILKENLELKAQMNDAGVKDGREKSEPADSKGLHERQRDELQMYYMYRQQQQRVIDHSRYMDPKAPPGSKSHPSAATATVSKPPESSKDSKEPSGLKERTTLKLEAELTRPKDRIKSESMLSPGGERTTPKGSSAEERRTPVTSAPASMPMVTMAYSHYYPHYAAGQMPFDPSHPAMFTSAGMMPYGSGSPAYMHPSQIRFPVPGMDEDRERVHKLMSPSSRPSEGSKALELLQQRASQLYGASSRGASPIPQPHKIHELKDAAKASNTGGPEHGRTPSPATKENRDKERSSTPVSSKDDKSRTSPPTQRHLHTHHHTHVVGPAYPIHYGPYPPVMTSPQGPGAPPMPPFLPKS